jgi:ATP-binding cassette subfamily F protein uup
VLAGDGTVGEYVGGYDDWLRQAAAEAPTPPVRVKSAEAKPRPKTEKPRKLSFKEERELEGLPERIGELEGEQEELHRTLSDPEFYRTAGAEVAKLNARLAELERELAEAYRRWEELETIGG